jgi:hypothetical protein
MQSDEHPFVLRFSVRADIPSALLDDDDFDERAFLGEWESQLKPDVLRAVFRVLRDASGWRAHVRSRGADSSDEIEVVVERSYPAD